jgi:ribosomal 50S subunit-associated protein YjgA (DUF615 family)
MEFVLGIEAPPADLLLESLHLTAIKKIMRETTREAIKASLKESSNNHREMTWGTISNLRETANNHTPAKLPRLIMEDAIPARSA